ncbi:MAG: EF2563 family selenium-dependent molybdenum hydroxylase system protein [Deltaproteobacteria bacterium]|jgi:xanthine dehydrogenase accessory factor|nr:EF2563 family selenium-dependent molybdenum hydroxylase system protein [Deltaproteobacteria bacterium]
MTYQNIPGPRACRILIKGAGEMASGIAVRLYRAGIREIVLLETHVPLAVRRTVSFCEAVYDGEQEVEGVPARLARNTRDITDLWQREILAVAVDPKWRFLKLLRPHVSIDAILAKRNLGTRPNEAPLVLALGPGFTAGVDAHAVIETRRGHNLGRIYSIGGAEADTGIPDGIAGYTHERVLRSPAAGTAEARKRIGDPVRAGEIVLTVNAIPVRAEIDGVLRGLVRPGVHVPASAKVGDIDPRGNPVHCLSVSDKARALGGAALEVVAAYLWRHNMCA